MERSSGATPPRQPGADSLGRDVDLLSVEVDRTGDRITIVALRGELDLSTIPRLEGSLFGEIEAGRNVVVDLTPLSFIDSSGIGLLIKAHLGAEKNAALLHVVVAPGSQVDRVFDLTGIGNAIPLFPDRDQAIEALPLPA